MKSPFQFFPVLLVFVLLISFGCKKDSNNDDTNQQQTGTVMDIQGTTYKTIKIGDQWWMAENLKTIFYNDSNRIVNVTSGSSWTSGTMYWPTMSVMFTAMNTTKRGGSPFVASKIRMP